MLCAAFIMRAIRTWQIFFKTSLENCSGLAENMTWLKRFQQVLLQQAPFLAADRNLCCHHGFTFSCSACKTLACVFSFVVCSEWFLCSISKLLCSTYLWTVVDGMSVYVNKWHGAKGDQTKGSTPNQLSLMRSPRWFCTMSCTKKLS